KRIEDLRQDLGRYASAIVANDDLHVVAGPCCLDQYGSTLVLVDRLGGVRDDVQEHLIDLRRRAGDEGNLAVFLDDLNLALQHGLGELQYVVEPFVKVEPGDPLAIETAEVLQVQHQLADLIEPAQAAREKVFHFLDGVALAEFGGHRVDAVEFLAERFFVSAGRERLRKLLVSVNHPFSLIHLVLDDLDVAAHVSKGGVNFVRHARHHLTDARHLLGLYERARGIFQFLVRAVQFIARRGRLLQVIQHLIERARQIADLVLGADAEAVIDITLRDDLGTLLNLSNRAHHAAVNEKRGGGYAETREQNEAENRQRGVPLGLRNLVLVDARQLQTAGHHGLRLR